MKKHLLPFTLFMLIILFFTSSLLNAQDNTAAAKPLDGVDRCWGMNFMWKKDFTIGKQKIDSYSIYNGESSQNNNWVTGFGVDVYTGEKTSLGVIGSVGTDNENSANDGTSNDYSSTELGIKVAANYYPLGMNRLVYWSAGLWVSWIYYNDKLTLKPLDGMESIYEYSTSNYGFGVNSSVILKPWKDLNLEFIGGYNLGFTVTPSYKIKTTYDGETTEDKGPNITRFQDCGGTLGVRLFF